MVWDVHAAEGAPAAHDVVAIDDVPIREDVGEGAFRAKLAVSLDTVSSGACPVH